MPPFFMRADMESAPTNRKSPLFRVGIHCLECDDTERGAPRSESKFP